VRKGRTENAKKTALPEGKAASWGGAKDFDGRFGKGPREHPVISLKD